MYAVLAGGFEAARLGGLYRTALRHMRGALEGSALWLLHLAPVSTALSSAVTSAVIGQAAIFPSLILGGLFMFAPLLVIDKEASAADALIGSVRLLRGQWLRGVLFYIAAALLSVLGALVCGVGMLLSYPVFFLSIFIGYRSLTQPIATPPPSLYAAPSPGVWPPPPMT